MLSDPRPRVLCVDDDEDSRVMLTTLLRVALIEAKAVGTAAQALSLIQTERFDLYLLDSRLPDLNGFELCRRMRAFDLHTPILSSFPELPMVSQQRPGSPWSKRWLRRLRRLLRVASNGSERGLQRRRQGRQQRPPERQAF